VIVLGTVGAAARRRRARRRARAVDPEPAPAPVPITRATVIDAAPLAGAAEADRWLDELDLHEAAEEAVATLNRVLFEHRLASADPWAREVSLEQALAVRVGHGAGEEVAEGRFTRALEPPAAASPRRRRRESALRPQERLAGLLGGRVTPLACEEMALRARADVVAGRWREAALQTDLALRCALAELDGQPFAPDASARMTELRELAGAARAAAQIALSGEPGEAAHEAVEQGLDRLEAALRARAAHSLT
jgi:hypothetical protein